jgi:hypothetical protein
MINWLEKKQKENSSFFSISYGKKLPILKFHKRIKIPVKCMPPVGNYSYEDNKVRKKIIFDITIRGKSDNRPKLAKYSNDKHETDKN